MGWAVLQVCVGSWVLIDWEVQCVLGGPWTLTGWAAQLAGGVVEELQSFCCEQPAQEHWETGMLVLPVPFCEPRASPHLVFEVNSMHVPGHHPIPHGSGTHLQP